MATVRRMLFVASLSAAVLVSPGIAAARPFAVSEGDQIVLSGTANVPRGTVVGEVVVVRGTAIVAGVARGDVVVIDGEITVTGQVSGSVIAVDGSVSLGPDAQVRGDVIARGAVDVRQGAKVGGRVRQHVAFMWRMPARVFGRFASWLAVTVSTLALGLPLVLAAPRGADAVFAAARTSPWASLGWGVGLAIAVPIVAVLAVASLVGLPLGIVLALALAFVAFLGYALSAYAVGRLLWRPPRNRALAFLFGWAIVRAVAAIPVVSGVTWGMGAVFGLGAAGVAIWRARAIGGKHREGRVVPLTEPMKEEAGL